MERALWIESVSGVSHPEVWQEGDAVLQWCSQRSTSSHIETFPCTKRSLEVFGDLLLTLEMCSWSSPIYTLKVDSWDEKMQEIGANKYGLILPWE